MNLRCKSADQFASRAFRGMFGIKPDAVIPYRENAHAAVFRFSQGNLDGAVHFVWKRILHGIGNHFIRYKPERQGMFAVNLHGRQVILHIHLAPVGFNQLSDNGRDVGRRVDKPELVIPVNLFMYGNHRLDAMCHFLFCIGIDLLQIDERTDRLQVVFHPVVNLPEKHLVGL